MTHDGIRKSTLATAVGPHDGMNRAWGNGQVDTLEDFFIANIGM
jgi:hypothetical protein